MEVALVPQMETLQTAIERFSQSAREAQDRWIATLQGAAGGPWLRQIEQGYLTSIDSAERMLDQNLKLQSDMLQNLQQSLEAMPSVKVCGGWLNLLEQAQQQRAEFWQRWFTAARKVDFRAAERVLEGAQNGQGVMEAFGKLSQQAMDQQAEWLRTLMPAAAPAAAELAGEVEAAEAVPAKPKSVARAAPRAAEA